MIKPALQDEAFLTDVRQPLSSDHELRLWWLGQSGFLAKHANGYALIDPYLSDSLTRKYATTDKPHVRMSERAVEPSELKFVDLVTASHGHTDHLDPDTLLPLFKAGCRAELIVPEAERELARRRSGLDDSRIIGLPARQYALSGNAEVFSVASAHETIECDAAGNEKYLGYVFWMDVWTVYHSGDTILYPGMEAELRSHAIDVALLPINGRAPERRVAGNLWGREAAWLAREIGAKVVIPCHYDMFEFNTADPYAEFVPECERLGQKYRVLRLGERWSSDELGKG
jgi:L-ascorbate metabolism protein UlaG (beta-lactamase superfamily)